MDVLAPAVERLLAQSFGGSFPGRSAAGGLENITILSFFPCLAPFISLIGRYAHRFSPRLNGYFCRVLALALFDLFGSELLLSTGRPQLREQVVVTGDDVASAYGAPGGFSRSAFYTAHHCLRPPALDVLFRGNLSRATLFGMAARPPFHTGSRTGLAASVWGRG